ncbi:MAG: hypothetical protein HYV27_24490 [Candidatus Hydrogenedentes bacterium]|nr:hypothetical protein [Candidatus Hydrogenedentota bacterium]
MISFCIAISCCFVAQYDTSFYGDLVEKTQTFTLQSRRGNSEPVFGALWHDGAFVSAVDDTAPGKKYMFVLDEPWNAPARSEIRPADFEISPESTGVRMQRLKQGWDSAGYELLDIDGQKLPVHEEDKTAADRARALVESRRAEAQTAFQELDSRIPPSPAPQPASPGFSVLWGGHAGVAIAGLLAMAAVWYYMVIRF